MEEPKRLTQEQRVKDKELRALEARVAELRSMDLGGVNLADLRSALTALKRATR